MKNKIFLSFVFLFFGLVVSACSPSPAADVAQAKEEAADIKKAVILRDKQVNDYITKVGNRLAKGIPVEKQIPEFKYVFFVINLNESNAFSLGGGYTYIFRDQILECTKEGELAGILAHEIAHSLLRHAVFGGTVGEETQQQELDADILATRILINAGYHPEDLVQFFLRLASQYKKVGASSGPSHPSLYTRARKVQELWKSQKLAKKPTRDTPEFRTTKKRLAKIPIYKGMLPPRVALPFTGGGGL